MLVNLIFVVLLLGGIAAALVVFALLQRIMNDPLRREKDRAWFAAFEAHREEVYEKDPDIDWRSHDLHEHWGPGRATPM